MRCRASILLMAGALLWCAGCSDPYSQHRIQLRETRMRNLAEGIGKMEDHRRERLRQMEPALKKWWHEDVEMFNKRTAAAGDYLW